MTIADIKERFPEYDFAWLGAKFEEYKLPALNAALVKEAARIAVAHILRTIPIDPYLWH